MAPIPITIVTGFLGSGKTTMILQLVPQLREANSDYRLALLKNEFGDLAVDSQLAASSAVTGVRELLNGCICCNLVGQLGTALEELGGQEPKPSRIVIETSGSAFPATLALEVNRLTRRTQGAYVLDGVVSVIDVENWQGYEDTSYTAKLQARYTDLVVFNKWEHCSERRFDDCLDRLGDLHADVAWVKSRAGWVDADLVFGIDGGLAGELEDSVLEGNGDAHHHEEGNGDAHHDHDHDHGHKHKKDHQSEVEVLSVSLVGSGPVNIDKLMALLKAASKEEVYRIKAVLSTPEDVSGLANSDDAVPVAPATETHRYILNWAFGRWTFTPVAAAVQEHASSDKTALRMTLILARYESNKWTKKLETGNFLALAGEDAGQLTVTKVA